jgi:hypothetical protein
MYNEKQLEHIESMTFWAMEFAVDRQAWHTLCKQAIDANKGISAAIKDAEKRAALSARLAVEHCEEAGLEPNAVLTGAANFLEKVGS